MSVPLSFQSQDFKALTLRQDSELLPTCRAISRKHRTELPSFPQTRLRYSNPAHGSRRKILPIGGNASCYQHLGASPFAPSAGDCRLVPKYGPSLAFDACAWPAPRKRACAAPQIGGTWEIIEHLQTVVVKATWGSSGSLLQVVITHAGEDAEYGLSR